MAKSSAERKREQIERLKQRGEYENFKKRQSEKQKRRHHNQKATMTFDQKEDLKKKRREEQRKYRAKNCISPPSTPSKSYKTKSAYGKAVAKAQRSLPRSPQKCKAVVKKLAITFSPEIVVQFVPKRKPHNKGIISEELKNSICEFYNTDSISYQTPGTRDFTIIRAGRKKKKLQKRYLFYTLSEAYEMFKSDNPNEKIGISKFSEFRPKHIFLRSDTPSNLCLCIYHENVRLILQPLFMFPNTTSKFIKKIVCSDDNKECMMSICEVCGKGAKFQEIINTVTNQEGNLEMKYHQWTKDEMGRVVRTKLCEFMDDILRKLREKLITFLLHVFVKRRQASHFEALKKNLACGTVVIQMDFSENYCFQYQDEIQSAHWMSNSCTLYTVIIYFKEGNNETSSVSYVAVSDYLQHDKLAVAHFNIVILADFKTHHPSLNISRIEYQSDGTAQHFKQKYSLCLLTFQKEETYWHFSATSHGKGPIDGLGGTVKRRVRDATRARQIDPRTAKEFAECAQQICPKIKVLYCPKHDITSRTPELEKLWSPNGNDIANIPETRKAHYFHALSKYEMEYAATSDSSSQKKLFSFITGNVSAIETQQRIYTQSNKDNLINLGEWVLVPFSGKKTVKYFVGQVIKMFPTEAEVKFLRYDVGSGKFMWPEKDDEAYVNLSDVKQKLAEPKFDSRLKYTFSDINLNNVKLG